uniref:Sema domain-containing protein n=1 Tax=Romanomermis culicivorax TaxID=13658 RepID=A0A915JA70_ROMCU
MTTVIASPGLNSDDMLETCSSLVAQITESGLNMDPYFAQIYDDKNETYVLMHEIDENFKGRLSRIARVCNNDNGRRNNPYILALFAKVSLNCSIWNDQAAFQFDIVELATHPLNVEYNQRTGNKSVNLLYAVFSTPNHVFKISAICAFALDDIRQAFLNNASFIDPKGQVTPPSPWILNVS